MATPLTGWNPWAELANLHNAMDRMFSDLFGSALTVDSDRAPRLYLPVDVIESEDAFTVYAPVPGFRPEEIEVTFSDGALTISARHSRPEGEQQPNYVRRELPSGDYARQLTLPGEVRSDEIQATIENGMLRVEVPKLPRPQPKRIPVAGRTTKELTGARS
ncbi:MAG TPA: Hsp20/alpha crystallin family protein [Candidatus Dormibacteraeota bacterium]|jgi:HSP20 family protein|nr:Hsp20/alpha crystallin family protein [Candidatus Dormibacteraeota bacterium]